MWEYRATPLVTPPVCWPSGQRYVVCMTQVQGTLSALIAACQTQWIQNPDQNSKKKSSIKKKRLSQAFISRVLLRDRFCFSHV